MPSRTPLFAVLLIVLSVLVLDSACRNSPVPRRVTSGHANGDEILTLVPRADDDTGFLPLFSEETLKHWRQCGPGRFVVENGVATGEGGMGLWWYSARQFDNFVLRGEFVQEHPIADSGVFLRFPNPGNDPWNAVHKGHEMEIGDPEPNEPTWRTGSIYPFCTSRKANTKPPGEWNRYEIACIGHLYSVRINDAEVLRWTDPNQRTPRGHVGLQNYPDNKTVRHRSLRIKPLP